MPAGRAERFPSRWVGREREQTVIKVRWCHPEFLLASRPARGRPGRSRLQNRAGGCRIDAATGWQRPSICLGPVHNEPAARPGQGGGEGEGLDGGGVAELSLLPCSRRLSPPHTTATRAAGATCNGPSPTGPIPWHRPGGCSSPAPSLAVTAPRHQRQLRPLRPRCFPIAGSGAGRCQGRCLHPPAASGATREWFLGRVQ